MYIESKVFLTFKSQELHGIFCNSNKMPALLKCQTQKIKWYCVVWWVSWIQILCIKSFWYWRRTRMKKLSLWFCLKCTFFLATFNNIFGYLLAFGGREDPKVLQWLCKSLHSLWFQDLIKKLLVIDRTKRIGNLKVFFYFLAKVLEMYFYRFNLFVFVMYN